ncbi:MAG: hypothetical protein JW910_09265 [Anaerolineae bacterium]|nr:hypothetical protein [Anaerolineae bacterium]
MQAARGKTASLVRAAQVVFVLNAVTWLVIGIGSLLRLADQGYAVTFVVVAVLTFGNAGAFVVCAWGVGRRHRWWLYLALAVLAVNIILSVTDEFGLLDLVTMLLDLVLAGLVIAILVRQRAAGGRIEPGTSQG